MELSKTDRNIRHKTDLNIIYYSSHVDEIDARLAELDEEWDIERTVETNVAALSLTGLALGILINRKWLMLPLAVGGLLIQHVVKGWCPPSLLLQRLGVRTKAEIERERYAIKALRGDFDNITTETKSGLKHNSLKVIAAVE